jgi:polyisoprenyl-teichoic acid--peptidoglycan teichoic acid transferase
VTRRGRGRRTWPQRLLLAFNCCFVLVMLMTAGGLAYVYSKYARLPRVELGTVLTVRPTSDSPQNFLVVGVDSAEGLDPDDPVRTSREGVGISGLRSDTIMILRVEPGDEQASLLSLPRDLWVTLASGGSQRINQAIHIGGPSELIQTIEGYLAIPINHYVQVDFAGFQDLVDAIGGVPVHFPDPARDRNSGLVVPDAGCVTLTGEQALAYVRSRTFQTFADGRWRTDPTADLGRISRQQDFIRRALRRAVDQGARNPIKADQLIDVALDSVVADDVLTADDIFGLAGRFRTFNPDTLDLYALPVVDDTVGGAAIVRMVDSEAQTILDLFRGLSEGDVEPGGVRVMVLNGSGRAGEARSTADALNQVGFGVAGTGEADGFDRGRSEIRYAPGQEAAADLVARWLVSGADLVEAPGDVLGADVELVTGADFDGIRSEPEPSTTTTAPDLLADEPGGVPDDPDDTAEPTAPATSTTVGVVPGSSDEVDC